MFYFCLDTTIVNSYLLFIAYWNLSVATKKKIRGTYQVFCKTLVDTLLLQYKTTTLRSIYTKPGYLPQARPDKPCQIHQKLKMRSKGRCQFCQFRNEVLSKRLGIIRGMLQDRRVRQSFTTCKHCCIYLCGNCFDLFHNFKSIL
jgi:hypothetical protein